MKGDKKQEEECPFMSPKELNDMNNFAPSMCPYYMFYQMLMMYGMNPYSMNPMMANNPYMNPMISNNEDK